MKTGIGSHTLAVRGRTDDWITPREIVEQLGPFDLDPCQCTPQPWACASASFTCLENGLQRDWFGRVWLNPPYGQQTCIWLRRLADHGTGTALIFARTETEMFHRFVWQRATSLLFISGRLYFHHADGRKAKGNAGGPSVLVAYGDSDANKLRQCQIEGAYVEKWRNQKT